MRRYQIIPLIVVGVLAAGTGGVVGYAVGSVNTAALDEALIASDHQLAAAGRTTSPPALRGERSQMPDNISAPSEDFLPRYMLGTDHGFIAVFYADDRALKERTMTPASALSPEERERLVSGIYIYTEEQLVRALQDYGS